MSQTLQLKREAASWWTTNNPTLAAGEPGFESDTKRIKIGDGSTAWNDLDYASSWPLAQAIAVGATTPVPGGIGARRWSTTTGCELAWDGAAWIIPAEGVQKVMTGSDYTNSTTTLTDVSGLAFSLVSGVMYEFVFHVPWRCAATTTSGIGLSLSGPTADRLSWTTDIATSATARTLRNSQAYADLTTVTSALSTTGTNWAAIRGMVRPTAAGTLQVRGRAGTAGSLATILAGAFGTLRAMGNAGNAVANPLIPVTTLSATTYTLTAADNGKHIRCISASPVTITVPTTLPVGFYVRVSQRGLGTVSFTHSADVNKLRKRDTLLRETAGGDATVSLLTDGADEHLLEGDLAVAP